MPRWISAVPVSKCSNRYLPRRLSARNFLPASCDAKSAGMGQRRLGWRTIRERTFRPWIWGAIPRSVVSTSGNSGMQQSQSGEPPLYRLTTKEPVSAGEPRTPVLSQRLLHRLTEYTGKHAALAQLAADLQLALVSQQNVLNNRQSQTGTAGTAVAAGFDPVETLCEVGDVFAFKARTVILHRDMNLLVVT